jgi:hypothetical protein
MDKSKSETAATSWGLIPLTPEYINNEHGSYVKALTDAISDEKVTNVALSGNYGVGKSSILHRFANMDGIKDRVVEISFSTISPTMTEEPSEGQDSTLTNRIQKEIVKQLLYREQPHKTPGSRFRRIEQFNSWREAVNSALASIGVMLLFLLTGWTAKLSGELMPTTYLGAWDHLLVFIIAFAVVFTVRIQSYGKFYIKQFETGAATITLDGNSASYFDQYLDEIVYFFQVSKRTIVVFEDIDRFDNPHIFETLRSLNRLLNNASQIVKRVQFIYAIKDSIFDCSAHQIKSQNKEENEAKDQAADKIPVEDPAQVELIRSNRTKFFDLVIPVVPFISHRSARDLLKGTLDGIQHTITPELLSITGRYVPDMRLLKNVRNEFIVFRDRLQSGDGAKLNLVENELLGMMLYKSTHLADFELIRLGKSNLDKLYEYSRAIVSDNVRRIERELNSLQQSTRHLKMIDERSKELGEKLLAYIQRTARHAGTDWRQDRLLFRSIQVTEHELQQSKFWIDFLFSADGSNVTYTNHQRQFTLQFSPQDISSALNIKLERDYWEKLSLELQEDRMLELKDDLKFLRSADMGALIKRPEFKSQTGSHSLHDEAVRLLTNGLAYQLVKANAINRNFTLYTATFHGKFVTPTALNFIIHHVEQDKMDMYYELNEADVHSLVKECGVQLFGEPAFYNIAILDCLLGSRPADINKMAVSLRSFGYEQRLFLQAYFSGGQYGETLVAQLIYNSPQIFKYLISTTELDVDTSTRQKLVSAALANAWRFKGVFTITTVEAEFMRSNSALMAALTVDKLEDKQIQSVVKIFLANEIRVPDLAALSESFKQEFIKHHLYELNIDNLRVAVGGDDNLSLDALHNINKNVYNNVMGDLSVYLDLIEGIAPTVADNSYFTSILEHVYQDVPDHIERVVNRAHKGCQIMDLNEINHDIWPSLARQMRFPPSFGNILAYTTLFDGVDANLATILMASEQITETNFASEEEKRRVAIWLLSESEELPNASLRVNLTVSLDLKEFIDVDDIPAENGELFALMVDEKNKIVEDSLTTYTHILDTDWSTKESFIGRSGEFANYIDSELLAGDLIALLQSQKIDINKKRVIVARADELIDGFSTEDVAQLAQFAVRNKCGLSIHIITAAALARAKSEDVLELLEPHISDISDLEITGIMQALGESYEALTLPGPDKPSFPNDQLHNALVNRLKQIGIVTKPTVKGNCMWVNKRRS